ncbi:MAG: hypothetical protein ACTSO7_00230 [Candidatus Heimdallarchaeota archaeon]
MVEGGEITRYLTYKILYSRKPTVRETADLEKFSKMFLNSLNKGFANEQWIEILDKVSTLPNKTFTFQIIGSRGTDNTHYYHIFKYESNYGWTRFKRGFRRFFSTPKMRKRLREYEFVQEETKDLIIDDITLGVSSGLRKNEVAIFSELVFYLGFVEFEIEIDEDTKGDLIIVFNYT